MCTITKRPDFELEATIFRIIGECINNTVKHAQAHNITIYIETKEKAIDVAFQDDGIGFDVKRVHSGNGLKNFEMRAREMNAELKITSSGQTGTEIILCVKIP